MLASLGTSSLVPETSAVEAKSHKLASASGMEFIAYLDHVSTTLYSELVPVLALSG
jgi:hypothetical protein